MQGKGLIALGTLLVAAAGAKDAAATPARTGFNHRNIMFGRMNPLGLLIESELSWRSALAPDGGFLLETSHVDAGLALSLTPVHVGYGVVVEVEPAAFLVLRARGLRTHYFGTLGSVYELGGTDADWSPERLERISEANAGHTADGWLFDASAQIRLAVGMPGPLLVVDARWSWTWIDAQSAFYEPYSGLLLEPDDLVTSVWAILGWRTSPCLVVGARWQLEVARADDDPRHTVGVAALWTLPHAPCEPAFGIIGLVGVYVDDPYREYEPFFAVGVSLEYGVAE